MLRDPDRSPTAHRHFPLANLLQGGLRADRGGRPRRWLCPAHSRRSVTDCCTSPETGSTTPILQRGTLRQRGQDTCPQSHTDPGPAGLRAYPRSTELWWKARAHQRGLREGPDRQVPVSAPCPNPPLSDSGVGWGAARGGQLTSGACRVPLEAHVAINPETRITGTRAPLAVPRTAVCQRTLPIPNPPHLPRPASPSCQRWPWALQGHCPGSAPLLRCVLLAPLCR